MPVNTCCCGGHLTPDCCQANDCCFDRANTRFRGHISMSIVIKGVASSPFASCVGTTLGTFHLEFDFDKIAVDGDFFCMTSFRISTESPSYTAYFTNIVCTWTPAGGSPVDVPIQSLTGDQVDFNLIVQYGDAWGLSPNVWILGLGFSINLYQDPTDSGSGQFWGASNSLFNPLFNQFAGNCLGIPTYGPQTYCDENLRFDSFAGFVTYGGVTFDHTEASVTGTVQMEAYNTYCCKVGGECVAGETPLENTDGTCA